MSSRVRREHQTEEYLLPLVVKAKKGDREASEELVRVMRPLVGHLLPNSGYSPDAMKEMESAGLLGLWEAVHRYDPNHPAGKSFWLVAWYRIRHEITEWQARNSGALPMPRSSAWSKGPLIDRAIEDYATDNPSDPFPEEHLSDEELDGMTGVPNSRAILQARSRSWTLETEDEVPQTIGAEDLYFNRHHDAEHDALTTLSEVKAVLKDGDVDLAEALAYAFTERHGLSDEVAENLLDVAGETL